MTADEQAAIGQALRSIGDAVVYWRTMAERMERERNEAFAEVKQLQAERDAAQEELSAERLRNAPLRARIKEIQEQHDRELAPLQKRVAAFDELWKRALAANPDRAWSEASPAAWPSPWARAQFGVLLEERDAALVSAAEMRAALEQEVNLPGRPLRILPILAAPASERGASLMAAAQGMADALEAFGDHDGIQEIVVRDSTRSRRDDVVRHQVIGLDLVRTAVGRWRALVVPAAGGGAEGES